METSPGFSLDHAVAAWRAELAVHPGPAPADLRELEVHLRDAFAEYKAKGLTDEEAFLLARHRVGAPAPVAAEFAKARPQRRWRWRVFGITFLVTFFFIFGASMLYLVNTTPEYVATATLRVLSTEATMDTGVKDPSDSVTNAEEFNTRLRLMETRDIAMQVANRMTDRQRNAFLLPFRSTNTAQSNMNNLEDRLLTQRSATPGRTVSILQVSIEHPDPQLAATVAQYFAEEFITYNNRLKLDNKMRAVEQLDQSAKNQQARIAQIQKNLDDLQMQNPDNFAVQAKYDQLKIDYAAAEEMYYKQMQAIEDAKQKVILGGENYQIIDPASGNVVQSEPKVLLLLVGGFFTALGSAFVVTLLMFVRDSFRLPPPPPQLAS